MYLVSKLINVIIYCRTCKVRFLDFLYGEDVVNVAYQIICLSPYKAEIVKVEEYHHRRNIVGIMKYRRSKDNFPGNVIMKYTMDNSLDTTYLYIECFVLLHIY